MSVKNHPAYGEELQRLDYTLDYVHESLEVMTERKDKLDDDITRGRKHFNSESSQDYIDLMIGTMMQDRTNLKVRNLIAARSKPYFARIDFEEDGKTALEKLYIGKMALIREEDQELIIVDWRAPVANLYYEERLGDASYNSPEGKIKGRLKLKRQFSINEGQLEQMFDIDITTNDEFLQASLGSNADSRLKEIVSTIQTEQNRVIRADMWTPLIVQGAAGGGKTTIALHRIAYLIYTYEKIFKPENFMIIAPNRFFLNYISEVLPELGVEKAKQTTFEEFAMQIIGQKFKIKDSNQKLNLFVNHNTTAEQIENNNMIRKQSEAKCSMLFKEIMDDYLISIENQYIPKEDFMLGSRVIMEYSEINDLFINQYRKLPIIKRIDEVKKHLTNRLKSKKDSIVSDIQDKCDISIRRIKEEMEEGEERQRLIIETIDKKNELLDKIELHSKKAVKEYINKISNLDPFQYYKELLENKELYFSIISNRLQKDEAEFLRAYTLKQIYSAEYDIEDIAPIMYLKYMIYGVDEKIPVRHIVIDEAQDFSVFQIFVLKNIIKDSSFTILGDLAQGIHSYRGIHDWADIQKHVFSGKSQFLLLEQSYRTTIEIMEAANKVIARLQSDKLIPAKPVIRHGKPVEIIRKNSLEEMVNDIADKLEMYKKEKMKSMAIICKTAEECEELHGYFKKSKDKPYIITGKEKEYKSGIVIVPSYLAKGLEFDVVFIANAEKSSYGEEELDIKLLYVAMTRPLHYMHIYYTKELSTLLEDV
ncbi:MAG: RNA polymerase recycling motor HelD [Bacillota bacterium]